MGAGTRSTESFSYAALRYPELKSIVPCFCNKSKCPDINLCEKCVHKGDCL